MLRGLSRHRKQLFLSLAVTEATPHDVSTEVGWNHRLKGVAGYGVGGERGEGSLVRGFQNSILFTQEYGGRSKAFWRHHAAYVSGCPHGFYISTIYSHAQGVVA